MRKLEVIRGGSGMVAIREIGGHVLLALKLERGASLDRILTAIRTEIAAGQARRVPLNGGAIVARDEDIPDDIREWCAAALDRRAAAQARRDEVVRAVNAGRQFRVQWKPWCGRLAPTPGNSLVATVEWLRGDGSVWRTQPASDAHLDTATEVA